MRVLQLPVPSAPDELVLAAQSAVRAVADAPLGGDAAGQVLVLLGMRAVLESAVAARLRVVEHCQAYAVDGSVTVTSWVDTRVRCGRTEAARTVGLARRLDRDRLVAAALAAGELTVGHAQVLGRALDVLPEHLRARQEPLFVAVARLTDPHTLGVELRNAPTRWTPTARTGLRTTTWTATGCSCQRPWAGAGTCGGDLDPLSGATLRAALDVIRRTDHSAGDLRSPGQRDADALVALGRQALDHADPARGVRRPTASDRQLHPGRPAPPPPAASRPTRRVVAGQGLPDQELAGPGRA